VPDFVCSKFWKLWLTQNDEWITARTGIKERRILKDSDKGTSF
jgi:3-oxoacyl-[acyl-carrier-protein] synthase-3